MNRCVFSIIFALAFVIRPSYSIKRNLSITKAPGCMDDYCRYNLFYVRADGPEDTLHYLWDFVEKPSIGVILTKLNNTLSIDWRNYAKGKLNSIKFMYPADYIMVAVMDKLIEFEDDSDGGVIANNTRMNMYSTLDFNWTVPEKNYSIITNHSSVIVTGTYLSHNTLSGSLDVQLMAFGDMSRDDLLPRLLHSENSTQATLKLKNLISVNSTFLNSRWAVDFLIVTSDLKNESLDIELRRSLDDEYSPGDFKMVNVVTAQMHGFGGNLQWRPVLYTTDTPTMGNSSDVSVMNPISRSIYDLNSTMAAKLDPLTVRFDNVLVQGLRISFGSPRDGFYKKTNYSSWTFLINYGQPQAEGFSMLIILIMSIGLGLPALLIIFGGTFFCMRRVSKRFNQLSHES